MKISKILLTIPSFLRIIHISLFLSREYSEKFTLQTKTYFSSTKMTLLCIFFQLNAFMFIPLFCKSFVSSFSIADLSTIISISIFFCFRFFSKSFIFLSFKY